MTRVQGVVRSAVVVLALWAASLSGARAERFDFVALGDTAYNGAKDEPVYARLIEQINQARPAFSIHVGDVWGGSDCQEPDHRRILDGFGRFDHPVIYTPGDNEWTDCVDPAVLAAWERLEARQAQSGDEALLAGFRQVGSRATRPGRWALESLARIRQLYFSTPRSLGQRTLVLERQPAVSAQHRQTVENARWRQAGVVFATVHVVGSMNGLSVSDPQAAAEAVSRNQANVDWIQGSFELAERSNAPALVLAMHASFFEHAPPRGKTRGRAVLAGRAGPYALVAQAIQEGAARFDKPVLLVHGDDHEFMIDRPFLAVEGEDKPVQGSKLTRLQVYGAPEIRAVRISVDTESPTVFSFAPMSAD
ncbi:MAG: hypothetical protein J0M20_14070 [Burkholderiales bacterium]|nr:hypothetical protein [Burkholderiales bacterium]